MITPDLSSKKVHFVSLGCSKNLVDSEVMLGQLHTAKATLTDRPEEAHVIIVNTCSFIGPAKEESIQTLLDLAEYKSPEKGKCEVLVMAGCLAQRYSKDLEQEMPEVDLLIGTGEYNKIVSYLMALKEGKLDKKSIVEIPKFIHTEFDPRLRTTPSYMAWLKISEGCNRNCTYCIIPTLRGKLRSRTVASLVAEASEMVAQGVKELNLISQDLSDYGSDLPVGNQLIDLLKALVAIKDLKWVRLFYLYPDDLTDEVIDFIASSDKICKYLDMPIQHFSNSVLKRMNRHITQEEIYAKIKRLREKVPQIVLRTSLIVGFPGESEEDFLLLLEGIEKIGFEHLGVFKYSDEEGTPAYRLKDKIAEEVIDERFERAYELQKNIIEQKNQTYIGKTLEVLIEGVHEETDLLLKGRFYGQAPDIDGVVIINEFSEDKWPKSGDICSVKITEVHEYDLIGTLL